MSQYTLYGADVSYYTGKARAYLRWRGVPFEEVLATGEVYKNIILPNVGWPVIPVMKSPGGYIIQDTADIIAYVEQSIDAAPSAYPEGEVQKFVAELIHLYADEWLVLPAMHYRWNYNEDWTYGEFGRMSAPHLTPEEQYQLGAKNGQRFKGALPPLGVSDATIPGIESSYESLLDELSAHFEKYDFIMGNRATLADFAMIGPMYAHLWRDPKSRELMESRAPKVADWVKRVHEGEGKTGDLPENDAIPDTLLPILARQMREQIPALMATIGQFQTWLERADDTSKLPRGFGEITVSIEGHAGPAQSRSFPLFRLQGALDAYEALSDEGKALANAMLREISGSEFTGLKLPRRLARREYRLALA